MSAVAVIAAAAVSAAFPISVGQERISQAELRHWERIAALSGGEEADFVSRETRKQVVQLLVSFRWIEGEAKRLDIVVGRRAVSRLVREQRDASFPKRRQYRRFLKQSGQTNADIRVRVRLDLLSSRIREEVGGDEDDVTTFVRAFNRRWKARTRCRAPYITSDCGIRVRSK